MYDFDVKEFWKENELCFKPFSTDKPRVPISYCLDDTSSSKKWHSLPP